MDVEAETGVRDRVIFWRAEKSGAIELLASYRILEYEELAAAGLVMPGDFKPSKGGYNESLLPAGGRGADDFCDAWGLGNARRGATGGGAADMIGIGGACGSGGVLCSKCFASFAVDEGPALDNRWSRKEKAEENLDCSLGCSSRISSSK